MQTNSQFCLWSKLLVTTLRRQDRDGYIIIIIIISSHGITMPNGLYFTAVFFLSSSVFRRPISEVTELISTKIRHIFTYDCYSKNLVRTPPGIYPHGLGQKTRFLGPTLTFDRTYLCNGTWYQQSEKMSIYKDSTIYNLHASQIWWILVHEQLRTVGDFCPPPKFSHWETLQALPHARYNRQQANFGTCYAVARAYSLEQQNAGRAHAGLCHTSSYYYYYYHHHTRREIALTVDSLLLYKLLLYAITITANDRCLDLHNTDNAGKLWPDQKTTQAALTDDDYDHRGQQRPRYCHHVFMIWWPPPRLMLNRLALYATALCIVSVGNLQ